MASVISAHFSGEQIFGIEVLGDVHENVFAEGHLHPRREVAARSIHVHAGETRRDLAL